MWIRTWYSVGGYTNNNTVINGQVVNDVLTVKVWPKLCVIIIGLNWHLCFINVGFFMCKVDNGVSGRLMVGKQGVRNDC